MSLGRTAELALLAVLLTACGSEEPDPSDTSALERLGIQEAEARREAADAVTSGQPYGLLATAGRTFKGLSDAERSAIITGVGDWARRYFASDHFRAAYAERRTSSQPAPPVYEESVDQAVARWSQEGLDQVEETRRQVVPLLPQADRAEMVRGLEAMQAQFQDPQFITLQRQGIAMQRESEQRAFEASLEQWSNELPEDANQLIARRLQAFLDACTDVDFGAELVEQYGLLRFADPRYERQPWAWKLCYRAGEASVTAAREVAANWLEAL